MTSFDRQFYLTLPSNASMDVFPNNTTAMYVTKLPKAIELSGEWVVSLKEISAPLAFDNIASGQCSFEIKNADEQQELFLDGGMYAVNESVLDMLNKLAANFNISFHLVGRRIRKVKVIVGETHEFRPNAMLRHVLGFVGGDYGWMATGEHTATAQMTLPPRMQVTTLYVYCDILQHVIVGDVTAPLLRVVDMKLNSKKLKMHTILDSPLYVPLQKKSFDTIEINLMTDTGSPVPFSTGKSHIVLEFKRVGLLDGL